MTNRPQAFRSASELRKSRKAGTSGGEQRNNWRRAAALQSLAESAEWLSGASAGRDSDAAGCWEGMAGRSRVCPSPGNRSVGESEDCSAWSWAPQLVQKETQPHREAGNGDDRYPAENS
jgi:hypothetical protein